MGTKIRPELSVKNKYWIDKHRYYELKHFCLQYPLWKRSYAAFNDMSVPLSTVEWAPTSNVPGDPTSKRAIMKAYYAEKIELIERIAKEADIYLHNYILKGVTEELSYSYLKSRLDIPCSRDMYYDRYRRFFWLLSEARN